MRRIQLLAGAALISLGAGAAGAEEHVVEMLNRGPDGEVMVFEPAVIHAEPGDTVRFVPTDKGHNAASIDGAVPEGAEEFRGDINKEVVYEVGETGLHAIKCTPHYAAGMVALIVAGDDFSNADEILEMRMPGRADDRMESYIEQARAGDAG